MAAAAAPCQSQHHHWGNPQVTTPLHGNTVIYKLQAHSYYFFALQDLHKELMVLARTALFCGGSSSSVAAALWAAQSALACRGFCASSLCKSASSGNQKLNRYCHVWFFPVAADVVSRLFMNAVLLSVLLAAASVLPTRATAMTSGIQELNRAF